MYQRSSWLIEMHFFSYLDLKLLGKRLLLEVFVPRVGIFLYFICFLHQFHVFFFLCEKKASGFYRNRITKSLSVWNLILKAALSL